MLQYASNLGMKMDYQFHDVFGLDPDLLSMIPQPCVALLLLFPINEKVCMIMLHAMVGNGLVAVWTNVICPSVDFM